jgi:esterase/lipase
MLSSGADPLRHALTMRFLLLLSFSVCVAASPAPDPSGVEARIAAREAREPGITPGAERRVRWISGAPSRSHVSVVYLHGYSATRQEVHPLPESVADALGANLYETRLTGHGRGGQAMLEGTVAAWQADAREALEIGRSIGERVVLLSTSTGGTLSVWLAHEARGGEIAALAMISPNFAPADKALYLLDTPLVGPALLAWFGADERSWEPLNDAQSRYWTWQYPWRALLELARLVKEVDGIDKSTIRTPALMIYSPRDQVIDPEAVRSAFAAWGTDRKRLIAYERSTDPSQHVLAGDIVSPGSTAEVAALISTFLRQSIAAGGQTQPASVGKSM